VGRLSELYVFVSNFCVTPWIAATSRRPQFQPSPDEVAGILEVPLRHITEAANTGTILIERSGCRFHAPCFAWGEHKIWGATSMILSELVDIVTQANG